MLQQVLVSIIVLGAALYLGRYLYESVRAVIQNKSGCGDGCGKCAFAAKGSKDIRQTTASKPSNIIPLMDIRSLPRKQ